MSPNLAKARKSSANGLLVDDGRGDGGTELVVGGAAGAASGRASLSDWSGCSPFNPSVGSDSDLWLSTSAISKIRVDRSRHRNNTRKSLITLRENKTN